MKKEIVHSVVLLITICFTFIFSQTSLANYDLQISAGLFIVLFFAKKYFVPKTPGSKLLESVIFTIVILMVINTTGGLTSPFFFLIYFLLFSLAMLLEPIISVVTTLSLIILFLLVSPDNQSFRNLLPVFSLAFLTPFALFLGQERIKIEQLKTKEGNTLLFLSLLLKNHVKNIRSAVENFMGDHELKTIDKSARKMEKLIDEFEKNN